MSTNRTSTINGLIISHITLVMDENIISTAATSLASQGLSLFDSATQKGEVRTYTYTPLVRISLQRVVLPEYFAESCKFWTTYKI